MKTNALKLTISMLSGSLLAGCGGGGETGTINDATSASTYDAATGLTKGVPINAKFLDAAVQGLQYKSNTYSSSTGADGGFVCASGEVVEFVIGSLSLGTSVCQAVVTPQTLAAEKTQQVVQAATTTSASGTTTVGGQTVQTVLSPVIHTDPKVVNRVRLLMSLDSDSNASNGITLPSLTEQASVTTTSLDFATTATFDSTATAVIQAMTTTANRSLVATTDASTHFNSTLTTLIASDSNYNLSTGAYVDKVAVAAAQAAANTAASSQGYGDGDDD